MQAVATKCCLLNNTCKIETHNLFSRSGNVLTTGITYIPPLKRKQQFPTREWLISKSLMQDATDMVYVNDIAARQVRCGLSLETPTAALMLTILHPALYML